MRRFAPVGDAISSTGSSGSGAGAGVAGAAASAGSGAGGGGSAGGGGVAGEVSPSPSVTWPPDSKYARSASLNVDIDTSSSWSLVSWLREPAPPRRPWDYETHALLD